MGAERLFEKACNLGIRGTIRMGAVKWKKLETDFVFPTAPGRRAVADRILRKGFQNSVVSTGCR